jgi:DnaJ-class molecular chaperone
VTPAGTDYYEVLCAWSGSPAQGLFDRWERGRGREGNAGVGEVELGFYEAARGGRRRVRYTARAVCAFCMAEPCEDSDGKGHSAAACDYCGGSGKVSVEGETEITIPAGVEDDATVPIGRDGEHVVIRVKPQPRDALALRVAAALGLVTALAFLAFLLLG